MVKLENTEQLRKTWLSEEKTNFSGWGFTHLDNRMISEQLPWDIKEIIRHYLDPKDQLLDMGTGDGEFLLSLNHPPRNTCVTEAFLPNVELCVEKLTPLGIQVFEVNNYKSIPCDDLWFDIVINRHEAFDASEVFRLLKPNGKFITQQVGGMNNHELSKFLIEGFTPQYPQHNLQTISNKLLTAGFVILDCAEYFPKVHFFDVGAIVYLAKIITWEFPSFSVENCFSKLLELQQILHKQDYIESEEHRFYLVCTKDSN